MILPATTREHSHRQAMARVATTNRLAMGIPPPRAMVTKAMTVQVDAKVRGILRTLTETIYFDSLPLRPYSQLVPIPNSLLSPDLRSAAGLRRSLSARI